MIVHVKFLGGRRIMGTKESFKKYSGFTELALLINLFPALMTFFLSAMYNESAKERKIMYIMKK
jgi:hypothetical protein